MSEETAAAFSRIRQVSDELLKVIAPEPPEVGLLSMIDAAVRLLKAGKGLGSSAACTELARIVTKIGQAEKTQ